MKKKYSLDLFRVIIVIIVFLFHANVHLKLSYGLLTHFLSQGAMFMASFFMLSGFILNYIYEERKLIFNAKDLKVFILKRISSIYPHYFMITLLFFIFYNNMSLKQNILIAPIEFFLVQSTMDGMFSVFHNGGTWFISCIFFCYLLYPYFSYIIQLLKEKYRICMIAILYLICGIAPFCVNGFQISMIYANPFFRILEFFMGMTIASLIRRKKSNNIRFATIKFGLLWIALIVMISLLQVMEKGNFMTYNFILIPWTAIMLWILESEEVHIAERIGEMKVIQWLSKRAYAIFLAQFFTWDIVKFIRNTEYLKIPQAVYTMIAFAICIVLTIVLEESSCLLRNIFRKITLKLSR